MKTCNVCRKSMELSNFHKCRANSDGHTRTCKKCAIEYSRNRYSEKRDFCREQQNNKNRTRIKNGLCGRCGNTIGNDSTTNYYCSRCSLLHKKAAKESRESYRRKALEHYGHQCRCCGENNIKFLTFDHIDGGGSKHRREIRGVWFGKWLCDNGFPNTVQVLCFNCNMGKAINNGVCPHAENEK